MRLLGEFTVVLSVTVEFSAIMLVTAEFTFVVLLRQRSVGFYSFTLLRGHTLQALVTCFALCHIVLNELLHFCLLVGSEFSHCFLGVFFVSFFALFAHFFYSLFTLLGQNVNSYGRDLYGKPRFADILDAVDQTGIERLRFATSHPKDLTDEVIEKFGSLRSLMPALHLPVQSGSNAILAAMNRRYSRDHYLSLISKIRDVRPDIALSTDIIVGFPGETAKDFEDTYRLVEEVGYHQVFTFIYSKREGTPAAQIEDSTPREVIQERFDRLVDLVQKRAFELNQPDVGSVVPILVEGSSKRDERMIAGKSPKNQTVHALAPQGVTPSELAGTFVNVKIDDAKTWYLSGHVLGANERL